MTLQKKDFDHVVNKFLMKTRDSRDLLAWLEVEVDGQIKKVARTKRSKGTGDLPRHMIRQQLHLNEKQFGTAIRSKLTREEYVDILKRKGIL